MRPASPRKSLSHALVLLVVTACATPRAVPISPRTASGHLQAAAAEETQARRAAAAGDSTRSELHREAAEANSQAAFDLLEAQRRACAGVEPSSMATFALERGSIRAVTPFYESGGGHPTVTGKGYLPPRLAGAVLTVFADLPTSAVEAILACRAARSSSQGGSPVDPLAVRDTSWKVTALEPGLVEVKLRVPDEAGAREMLGRAQALLHQ